MGYTLIDTLTFPNNYDKGSLSAVRVEAGRLVFLRNEINSAKTVLVGFDNTTADNLVVLDTHSQATTSANLNVAKVSFVLDYLVQGFFTIRNINNTYLYKQTFIIDSDTLVLGATNTNYGGLIGRIPNFLLILGDYESPSAAYESTYTIFDLTSINNVSFLTVDGVLDQFNGNTVNSHSYTTSLAGAVSSEYSFAVDTNATWFGSGWPSEAGIAIVVAHSQGITQYFFDTVDGYADLAEDVTISAFSTDLQRFILYSEAYGYGYIIIVRQLSTGNLVFEHYSSSSTPFELIYTNTITGITGLMTSYSILSWSLNVMDVVISFYYDDGANKHCILRLFRLFNNGETVEMAVDNLTLSQHSAVSYPTLVSLGTNKVAVLYEGASNLILSTYSITFPSGWPHKFNEKQDFESLDEVNRLDIIKIDDIE